MLHPNKEEFRQRHQETCIDKQGDSGQTQREKRGLQRVGTSTGSLGGIQRNCLSSQGFG